MMRFEYCGGVTVATEVEEEVGSAAAMPATVRAATTAVAAVVLMVKCVVCSEELR